MNQLIKNTLSGIFVMSLGALSTLIFTNNMGVVRSEAHIIQANQFHEDVATEIKSIHREMKQIRKDGYNRDAVLATISSDLKHIKEK